MDAELATWLLSLPVEVRRELAKVDGPGWHVDLYDGWEVESVPGGVGVPIECSAVPKAWLPCDPTAILRHAAGLKGPGWRWTVRTLMNGQTRGVAYDPCDTTATATFDGADPHRAAVEVLCKVMGVARG